MNPFPLGAHISFEGDQNHVKTLGLCDGLEAIDQRSPYPEQHSPDFDRWRTYLCHDFASRNGPIWS
jgi:hypothetical protein